MTIVTLQPNAYYIFDRAYDSFKELISVPLNSGH